MDAAGFDSPLPYERTGFPNGSNGYGPRSPSFALTSLDPGMRCYSEALQQVSGCRMGSLGENAVSKAANAGSMPAPRAVSVGGVMLSETTGTGLLAGVGIAPDCPRIGQVLKRSGYPRGLLRKI